MKRLEITFSEEDVNLALETYINRFFLPHRQVRIESIRSSMREGKSSLTATVLPAPTEPIPIVDALCICGHPRLLHANNSGRCLCTPQTGHGDASHFCLCIQFEVTDSDEQ